MKFDDVFDNCQFDVSFIKEYDTAGSIGLYIDDLAGDLRSLKAANIKDPEKLKGVMTSVGVMLYYIDNQDKLDGDLAVLMRLLGYTQDSDPKGDLSKLVSDKQGYDRTKSLIKSKFFGGEEVDTEELSKLLRRAKIYFSSTGAKMEEVLKPIFKDRNIKGAAEKERKALEAIAKFKAKFKGKPITF